MIEYEVMRMGCGPAYDRGAAIKLAVGNLMRDALKRGVNGETEVDWTLFVQHVRGEVLESARPDGTSYVVVLTMAFASEAEAIFFKIHYAEHMRPKVLPDKHFHKDGVVALGHGEDGLV